MKKRLLVLIMIINVCVLAACGNPGNNKNLLSDQMEATADEGVNLSLDDADMDEAKEPANAMSDSGNTLLEYAEGVDGAYLSDCIFLGDSRYVAMYNNGYMPSESVLAMVGISHGAALTMVHDNGYTLSEYLASHQAGVIYIGYGVNGMTIPEEDYKDYFEMLIDKVIACAPDSKIVICSIWPVEDDGIYSATVSNARIDYYNDYLLELAKSREIYFLDFSELLKDEDGTMRDEYNIGDGLHYTKESYIDIMNYIICHPVAGYSRGSYYYDEYDYEYQDYEEREKYSEYYIHEEESGEAVTEDTISDNCVSENSVSIDSVSDASVSANSSN